MRHEEDPKVGPEDIHGRAEARHPAFAVISASRISGTMQLFASDIRHDGFVRISICEAVEYREAYEDKIFGSPSSGKLVAEVNLSESQWVAFVSRMNIGNGTPCTLGYARSGPMLEIPEITKQHKTADKLRARAKAIGASQDTDVEKILAEMEPMVQRLPKKEQQRFRTLIQSLTINVRSNIEFGKTMLTEHAEKAVTSAMVEIDAAINSRITALGIKSLQQLGASAAPQITDQSNGTEQPKDQ